MKDITVQTTGEKNFFFSVIVDNFARLDPDPDPKHRYLPLVFFFLQQCLVLHTPIDFG